MYYNLDVPMYLIMTLSFWMILFFAYHIRNIAKREKRRQKQIRWQAFLNGEGVSSKQEYHEFVQARRNIEQSIQRADN